LSWAPLFIEVETRLVVRHASILTGCLPLEPTDGVSFLFEFAEDGEAVVEASDSSLRGFRV
jgi:hypothetical protein